MKKPDTAEKFLNEALSENMNISTLKPLAWHEIMTQYAKHYHEAKSDSSDGLCWGQKKPTTPGYYWYKGKTGKPYVGHVKSPDDLWVNRRSGEWAGPIPEPTT